MKYKNFDSLEEQINDILNMNALLALLNEKGIISAKEFVNAKQKALEEFKAEHPDLFKSSE
ncbi:hypothetical protein RYX45_01565 [Alkalihalophilus pseudofirmus]|uniref:SHOCT domain-containing protein n=1 Tax=Alkalihalophilus pseudofirmus TaxID=79885 RepID=A0AAJ2NK60_ALKPS|nr:hypothetical protein [Alkalihalophilus pseudofirmus]MDV2883851.1 hypothetical protein [Alkalihalophilus pseudofirmus]